jgi:hypothetical protein
MICCREAKIVLLCLAVHVGVMMKVIWFKWAAPDGLEEVQMLLLIVATGLGFVLGFKCIHTSGVLNRLVGVAGLAWFGVLIVWVLMVSFVL